MNGLPMDETYANVVYDALVLHAGANKNGRAEFVYHQTSRFTPEYRFVGGLGFGGKFWRTVGTRNDGTWGEKWLVNNYSEDDTVERVAMVNRTNAALNVLCELFWKGM